MGEVPTSIAASGRGRRWRWLGILVLGFVLWLASVLVTALTANTNLIPAVVLLGSFTIPVSAVVWNFDHEATIEVTPQRVFYAFIVAGLLGVLAASLLESWLVQDSVLTYLGVGLIEEFVKGVALAGAAWGLHRYATRDGFVLGASVGFGFAALESSGYAFNALLTVHGLSLSGLVETEVLRGILAPVGHGLWTAILGAAMFRAARPAGRLRLTWGVFGTYLLVSVLHALWDSMRGLAVALTLLLTATQAQMVEIENGLVPRVSPAQEAIFVVVQFVGLILVTAIGIGVLLGLWVTWGRDRPAPPPGVPATGG